MAICSLPRDDLLDRAAQWIVSDYADDDRSAGSKNILRPLRELREAMDISGLIAHVLATCIPDECGTDDHRDEDLPHAGKSSRSWEKYSGADVFFGCAERLAIEGESPMGAVASVEEKIRALRDRFVHGLASRVEEI